MWNLGLLVGLSVLSCNTDAVSKAVSTLFFTTQLAGLLTHVYFGDRAKIKSWPPSDYE